jgi:t-SNARE complex subunit (syntaxin)
MRFTFHGEQLDTEKHSIDKQHLDGLSDEEQVSYAAEKLHEHSDQLRGLEREYRKQIAAKNEEIKQIKKKLAKTQTEKYETNGKRGRMRSHYEQNKPL